MTREKIPTAVELGLMGGPPPFPPERLVTLANWQDPPFNRWAFRHVGELIPSARIARGDGPVSRLPEDVRDLTRTPVRSDGRPVRLATFLERTYTDGIIVLHGGRVLMESYFNGMAARTRHLLMSVSKSVTSVVCGRLVGRGLLSPNDPVTTHLPDYKVHLYAGLARRPGFELMMWHGPAQPGLDSSVDVDDAPPEVAVARVGLGEQRVMVIGGVLRRRGHLDGHPHLVPVRAARLVEAERAVVDQHVAIHGTEAFGNWREHMYLFITRKA